MAINKTYEELVESAKPKKTTDDCYTPDNIYEVVAEYVAERYGISRDKFVRPFYPDGDYQVEDYTGKVVVDNPPFSILSKICKWYHEHGVKYFLFSPGTTSICAKANYRDRMAICIGISVAYANGARVNTGFVTNLEPAGLRTDPELYRRLQEVNLENIQAERKLKQITEWEYPKELVTAAMLNKLSKYGQELTLATNDLYYVHSLDNQEGKHAIYGGGLLITDKAKAQAKAQAQAQAQAQAKAQAQREKKCAVKVELSERERRICGLEGSENG